MRLKYKFALAFLLSALCLNGAAARKVCVGDVVIIVAYASMKFKKAKKFKPTIVHVNNKNEIIKE